MAIQDHSRSVTHFGASGLESRAVDTWYKRLGGHTHSMTSSDTIPSLRSISCDKGNIHTENLKMLSLWEMLSLSRPSERSEWRRYCFCSLCVCVCVRVFARTRVCAADLSIGLEAPKQLKLRISNLTSVFQKQSGHFLLKIFRQGDVARVTWPTKCLGVKC